MEPPTESPDTGPLTTLEQILTYDRPGWGQGFAPVRPRPFVAKPFPPLRSRLLVCHDLAGGYGEDRWVEGGGYDRAYRMYDWGIIDIFVYFSHNLVTIPPAGWTDVAHRHGTRVLGTFITEWGEGLNLCAKLLQSEEVAERAATKLAQIAVDHGFDGWLVNIENKIVPVENVGRMVYFVECLTAKMRAAKAEQGIPLHLGKSSATVIWYDSVTTDGNLKWQNRLNSKNRVFFDACDGIFTNYHWARNYPTDCALEAAGRRLDVYMGIDVFGRGTWGGGGFHVDSALRVIQNAGVSAALFAPAWTLQNKTSGGGRVDPSKGLSWGKVEGDFENVDGEFWAKITKAWHAPRPVPGSLGGSEDCAAIPLVVNFGCGVGEAWRIVGEEVAVFGTIPPAAGHDEKSHREEMATPRADGLVGGAFYNLASQCLTPLVALGEGRGAASKAVVQAKLSSQLKSSAGDANGSVRAKWSFEESFDGGSCLSFAGLLDEKASATFPLYSCDFPLPPEPLEVRITFSCNTDSEIALVLVLGGAGEVEGRREIVLRGWGQKGPPDGDRVFSRRLALSEQRVVYSPAQEEHRIVETPGVGHDDDKLLLRVRALREAGESYDAIWSQLRSERSGRTTPSPAPQHLRGGGTSGGGEAEYPARARSTSPSKKKTASWITRKFVVRDLRMGGFQAVREIRLVCARRKPQIPESGDEGEALRLYRAGGVLRGVAGLAVFRASVGELVVGPWRKDTPCTFGKIGDLRAVEATYQRDESSNGIRACMDLSLEWEFSDQSEEGVSSDAGYSWRTLHCDLWRASEKKEGGWKWLGRAYGTKYRLQGLEIGGAEAGAGLILAVQQVNAMGYREAEEDWARIEITPI
ncbi:unnamed protein product [Ascophyllum nodosum]